MTNSRLINRITPMCATALLAFGAASCVGGDIEPVVDPILEAANARITWRSGRYALTTDPTDAGLYFKFGSVVGIFSGNGTLQVLPVDGDPSALGDAFDAGDVAWSPVSVSAWGDVPAYSDHPAAIDHSAPNVRAGKGDPCRLVGVDLAKIASADVLTAADVDNGLWRLPTESEQRAFVGIADGALNADHWATVKPEGALGGSGVGGAIFPTAAMGNASTFLPAAGNRGLFNGAAAAHGNFGFYWSSTPISLEYGNFGAQLFFASSGAIASNPDSCDNAASIRCVRQ